MSVNLKPNKQRAQTLITLLWIVFFLNLALLISNYFQYDLVLKFLSYTTVTDNEFHLKQATHGIITLIYLLTLITCYIAFVFWFRRAYYNLHQRASNLKFSEGWAAGAWFVPFLNLVRPFQIMKEIYEKTIDLLKTNRFKLQEDLNSNILGLWWLLWIVSNTLMNLSYRLPSDTGDDILTQLKVQIASALVGLFSTLITIKVVTDYAKVEPLLVNLKDEIDSIGENEEIDSF